IPSAIPSASAGVTNFLVIDVSPARETVNRRAFECPMRGQCKGQGPNNAATAQCGFAHCALGAGLRGGVSGQEPGRDRALERAAGVLPQDVFDAVVVEVAMRGEVPAGRGAGGKGPGDLAVVHDPDAGVAGSVAP